MTSRRQGTERTETSNTWIANHASRRPNRGEESSHSFELRTHLTTAHEPIGM